MTRFLLAACLTLTLATAAQAQQPSACPPTQSEPSLSPGGNVFGFTSAQWEALFGAKADTANGCTTNQTLINPTIIGGAGSSTGNGAITTILLSGTYPLPAGTSGQQIIIFGTGTVNAPATGNILNIAGSFVSAVTAATNASLLLNCTQPGQWIVISQSGAWTFS